MPTAANADAYIEWKTPSTGSPVELKKNAKGSTATVKNTVTGLKVELKANKNLNVGGSGKGSVLNNAQFVFKGSGKLSVGNELSKGTILGSASNDSIAFTNKISSTSVKSGSGNDTVTVGNVASSSNIQLGAGADLAFIGKSGSNKSNVVTSTTIDLGKDSSADKINVLGNYNSKTKLISGISNKGLTITNIRKQDSIVIGGTTYSHKELLKNQSQFKSINFKFES